MDPAQRRPRPNAAPMVMVRLLRIRNRKSEQGGQSRSTPQFPEQPMCELSTGRAEGEPIALEVALGRGRIYARSVCDAAPACGPEGHRLARGKPFFPARYGTM